MPRPAYPRSPDTGSTGAADSARSDSDLSLEERAARQMEESGKLNRYLIGYGEAVEADWTARGLEAPDLPTLQRYRVERLRAEMRKADVAGMVLFDPLNVRYLTDSTNMQVWIMHNAARYAFVATEGPVILFEYNAFRHLSAHSVAIDEIRPATGPYFFHAGTRLPEVYRKWSAEIADLIDSHGGGNRRLAVDHSAPDGIAALQSHNLQVVDAQPIIETARNIKSAEEIKAMRRSMAACLDALDDTRAALKPGMTELELWGAFWNAAVSRGAEWVETCLLAAGPRTNPWFHECSGYAIQAGDIVGFDTDLVGPYGYCADISRTWLCGDDRGDDEQRALYAIAHEQVQYNLELLKPGLTFREFVDKARLLPEDCLPRRYGVLVHGVGLCDEWPAIPYPQDFERVGFDGVFEPGMVVCVESYTGRVGGREGVKLEEQVVITETGYDVVSVPRPDPQLS